MFNRECNLQMLFFFSILFACKCTFCLLFDFYRKILKHTTNICSFCLENTFLFFIFNFQLRKLLSYKINNLNRENSHNYYVSYSFSFLHNWTVFLIATWRMTFLPIKGIFSLFISILIFLSKNNFFLCVKYAEGENGKIFKSKRETKFQRHYCRLVRGFKLIFWGVEWSVFNRK